MRMTISLTEVNAEIERLERRRNVLSPYGRTRNFSKWEESELEAIESELAQWRELKSSALEPCH